jgi:hypothetical protein
MMVRMRREVSSDELNTMPEIDSLILIDRDVDMVTPCCTQLTYEGLVDETFGIQNSTFSACVLVLVLVLFLRVTNRSY